MARKPMTLQQQQQCLALKDALNDALADTGNRVTDIAKKAGVNLETFYLFLRSESSPNLSTMLHYCKLAGIKVEVSFSAPNSPKRVFKSEP
jgi:DNA-binding phage protein